MDLGFDLQAKTEGTGHVIRGGQIVYDHIPSIAPHLIEIRVLSTKGELIAVLDRIHGRTYAGIALCSETAPFLMSGMTGGSPVPVEATWNVESVEEGDRMEITLNEANLSGY